MGGPDTKVIRSSWCAGDNSDDTAYLQLDAGKIMSIGGAVIQGRDGNFNEYVTRLKFSFSANGVDWFYVDEGMSFDGNDNSFAAKQIVYSKVYAARYLRFIPIEFFGHKSLRAAMLICDEECTPSLYNPPADRRQHNGVRGDCGLGLLGGIAWCAATKNLLSSDAYLQIDSGQVSRISGVHIGGKETSNEWVISLKFKASNDTNTWMEIDNGTTFAGNTDPEAIQIISFSKIVVARFVRLMPVLFYKWPSMKAALELCTHAYTSPTSACTNQIYNPTIKYRSANSNHENCTRGASLGVPGGWCLLGNSAYMDIDMTYMANINGAAIEGKSDMPQYVTLIKFKISNDNVHWYDIDGGKIFEANHDNLNRVILFFQSHIMDGIYVLCQSDG